MNEEAKKVLTNALVIGSSGTGKAIKYIKPIIPQKPCGVICDLPSKEVLKDFIEDNQIKGIDTDSMKDGEAVGNISLDYTNHLVYVMETGFMVSVYGREGLVKYYSMKGNDIENG